MPYINYFEHYESILPDVEIKCKCGHITTRRQCKSTPAEYVKGMVFTNYHCDSCGAFLRCDSQFVQPMKDDKTGDNDNE